MCVYMCAKCMRIDKSQIFISFHFQNSRQKIVLTVNCFWSFKEIDDNDTLKQLHNNLY